MAGWLELREEPFGLRHFLNDGEGNPRRVHAGAILEVCLQGGYWLAGRYEWTFESDDPPALYISLEGTGGPQAVLNLPPEAFLRWPDEAG